MNLTAHRGTTPYFSLHEVTEALFAAIVEPGSGAWGNAGIIDLGDRTLVFDCSFEISRKRLQGKTLDRFEREERAFFERVRAAYLERSRAEPQRIRVVDAGLPLPEIRKALESALSDL